MLKTLARNADVEVSVWTTHPMAEFDQVDTGTVDEVYANVLRCLREELPDAPVDVVRSNLEDPATGYNVFICRCNCRKKTQLLLMTHVNTRHSRGAEADILRHEPLVAGPFACFVTVRSPRPGEDQSVGTQIYRPACVSAVMEEMGRARQGRSWTALRRRTCVLRPPRSTKLGQNTATMLNSTQNQ